MGAFCVYGASKSLCRARIEKKLSSSYDEDLKRAPTVAEWAAKRDKLTEAAFVAQEKREKISPEFDAPQFCKDWIAADPSHIRMPLIMVRAEKTDKHGERILKAGAPVMTWVEYVEPRAALF
jgi:hypothetical protein